MSEENKELDLTPNQQNQIIEKAKKSWVRNPQENFGMENVQAGDNAKYLRHNLLALDLPPIDLDSDEQVLDRIQWYFNHCVENDMKPGIAGLCNALGISRMTFFNWQNKGSRDRKEHQIIAQRAKAILEDMMEQYMMNGKVNPVSGIFLMKNNFEGYYDRQDVVLSPGSPLDPQKSETELKQLYSANDVEEDDI